MFKKVLKGFSSNIKRGVGFFQLGMSTMWEIKGAWVIVYALSMLVLSLGVLVNTFVRGRLVDAIAGFINKTGSYQAMITWVLITVGLALFLSLTTSLDAYFSNVLSLQSDEALQRKALRHAMSLQQMVFDSTKLFPDVCRALTQLRFSLFGLFQNVFRILTGLIGVVGAVLIITQFHWWLALLAVVAAVPFAAMQVYTARAEFEHFYDTLDTQAGKTYYGHVLADRSIAKEVRTFGCAPYFDKLREESEKEFIKRNKKISKILRNWNVLPGVFNAIVTGGILIYIAYQAWLGLISPGQFVFYAGAYQALHTGLQNTLTNLYGSSYENWMYSMCEQFMHYNMVERDKGEEISPLLSASGLNLEFDKVSFTYHGSVRKVLSDLSFNIAPKEKIAIVGLNGAGKTTLIRLLCGLYQPDTGHIRLEGKDEQEFRNQDIYKCFGAVFQDFGSYQISLRDNIALCDLENKDNQEQVDCAAQMGGISDIMHKFPNGYDTLLGRELDDNGVDLSGGEWQKLALARSYFAKRKILIFDEPTSALDPQSEYTLMNRAIIENPDSTVIVISHRLAVATLVDRVLFLDGGKIIEDGSHKELMLKNGKYAEMFRSQAAKYQIKDFVKEGGMIA